MAGNLEGKRQHVVRIETGIDGLQAPEAAQHEACADYEDDGERDFDRDEGRAGEAAAGVSIETAKSLFERFVDVGFNHAQRGKKAGEQSGDDGEREREEQDRNAETDVAHAGQLVCKEFDEKVDTEVSENKP